MSISLDLFLTRARGRGTHSSEIGIYLGLNLDLLWTRKGRTFGQRRHSVVKRRSSQRAREHVPMRDLETFDGRSQLSDGREEEELLREKQRSETKTKG